jgi:hypothetical protein
MNDYAKNAQMSACEGVRKKKRNVTFQPFTSSGRETGPQFL